MLLLFVFLARQEDTYSTTPLLPPFTPTSTNAFIVDRVCISRPMQKSAQFAVLVNTKTKRTVNFHSADFVLQVTLFLMLVKMIKNIKCRAIAFNVHQVNSVIQEHSIVWNVR